MVYPLANENRSYDMKKTFLLISLLMALVVLGISSFQKLNAKPTVSKSIEKPIKSVEVVENKKTTIKLGVFEPLTGSDQEGGISELEGVMLANELYPTVNGNPIVIYSEDIKSDRYQTADALMRLIEGKEVKALIGSWGSAYALAAGPIINEEEIPTVGASCTNPRITIGNKYYSRVSYIDTFQGTALADFASRELKAQTVGILMEQGNEYSVDLGEYFTNAFAEINNYKQSILYEGFYQTGQKDYSAILTSVKALNPDILFIPGNHIEVAIIAKQAKNMGVKSKIIGTDTLDTNKFIQEAGASSEGVYYSTFYSPEFSRTQESTKFLKAYKEKYGKSPNSFSALGYDAYLLIYDALKRTNRLDGNTLNEAIHEGKNIEGAAGFITMDQNGDAKRPVVIKSIKNGHGIYVTSIEP